MAQSGHIRSANASVRFITTAGSFNLSPHGNTTDIDFSADDVEVSAYGDGSHTFIQALTNFTITLGCWWAGSNATKVDDSNAACIFRMVYQSSTCQPVIQISPAGSSAGSLSYAASVNVQSFPMSFPVDGVATMNITCTARAGSLTACPDSIYA